ncbi:MAG: beta-propeller fold lactonase family protein [Desulfobulbaceae bacterium]|nr:beta-propeller fold lactonase family protein [Desulfobulbaceae bacterium]
MKKTLVLIGALLLAQAAPALAGRFTDLGNQTVTDRDSGLMWQQSEGGAMNWEAALSYCQGLNLATLGDWRLPNLKELNSLIDHGRSNPALDSGVFPNGAATAYWSATSVAGVLGQAWTVEFAAGATGKSEKTVNAKVRCLRGSSPVNTPPVAGAGPDQQVAANTPVSLDGSTSSDADGDPLTYGWSFLRLPAGSSATIGGATSATPSFTPDLAGKYLLQLTVADGKGGSGSDTVMVTAGLVNTPPVAQPGGPYQADLGSGLALNGSGSSDPDAAKGDSIVGYSWSIDNGAYTANAATPILSGAEVAALGLGQHTVRLTVTDSFGASSSAATTLAVYHNVPVASYTASPNPAACNQSVTFDGSGSVAGRPDLGIVTYAWDFGDGTSGSGATTGHAYNLFGSYAATLTITDNTSPATTASQTATVTVNQGNRAPVANPGGPYLVNLGEGVALEGGASSDPDSPCGDAIVSYSWSIDGGAYSFSGVSPSLSIAQINGLGLGAHTADLTVTDSFGASSSVATTITIYNNVPTADFTATPNPAACSQSVTFDGSASSQDRPDRSLVSYVWDYGDGNSGNGVSASHAYSHFGTYAAKLTVTDSNTPAKTDSKTITINVNQGNQAPVANPGGPYLFNLGESAALDGGASSDPDTACGDALVSYAWSIDGGALAFATSSPSLSAAQVNGLGLGAHSAQLTVTDSFGASNSATATINIYNNVPAASFTANPNPAACSQGINFDGSGSSHGRPDRNLVAYAWDYGDGTSGSSVSSSHAYSHFGSYSATLTVTDNNTPAKIDSKTITVNVSQGNHAPVANAGGPYLFDLGSGATLNGSASSDSDTACGDSLVSYAWSIDGGALTFAAASPTLSAAQVNGLGLGAHSAQLTVTDTFGASNSATATINIYNNTPVANFTASPNPAACNQTISFDGSSSYQGRPDRSLVAYVWDYGDGNSGSGVSNSHAYSQFGSYAAKLTVTDNNVSAKSDSKTVTVNVNQGNSAPVANPGGPYPVNQGSGATLNGTASSDPDAACGDTLNSYEWDVNNDGTYDFTGATVNLSWAQLGSFGMQTLNVPYTVKLRVTDSFGASSTATTTLTVTNTPPVANGGPDQNVTNWTVVTLNGSTSSDADSDPLTYSWSFISVPTGSSAVLTGDTTIAPTFRPDLPGNYVVQLVVNDGKVASPADMVTITSSLPQPRFAYVANNNSNTLSMYTVDSSTGALRHNGYVATETGPESVAVDPLGRFAYVVNDSNTVSVYTVNPTTGVLTPGTAVATGTKPYSVTVDHGGKYAYVANYTSNNVSVYTINQSTGALTAGAAVATGTNPQAVVVDPSGKFAYVANYTSNNVSVYTINQSTGALTAGTAVAAGTGPSSLAVDPFGRFAYATNYTSNTVLVYTINPATGALTAGTTVASSNPISVTVDPSGRFAYATNYTANMVSVYTINQSTGALTAGAAVATGQSPYAVTVDPSGRYAQVVNHGSNTVSIYAINQSTGALTLSQTISTQNTPAGIVLVGGSAAVSYVPKYAYTANGGSSTIGQYSINQLSGDLSGGTTVAAGTVPYTVAVDPAGRFLYASNFNSSTVSAYTINQTTGVLTAGTDVATGTNPRSLAVDPSGRFLYVSNFNTNDVWIFSINQTTGALTYITSVGTGSYPWGITVDPSGKFAYVENYGSGDVSVYTINQSTGGLAAGPSLGSGTNPKAVIVDPTGRFAYVTNYGSNTVSVYTINQSTGALTAGTAVTTGTNPWGISIDPSGRFAYIANYGSNTVSVYTINQSTGALTVGTAVATVNNPAAVNVDPSGKFVYVTSFSAASTMGFVINQTTGALTAGATVATGSNPVSIITAGGIQ